MAHYPFSSAALRIGRQQSKHGNSSMEAITSGIHRLWLSNGHVVCYSIDRLTVATVIEWSRAISASLKNWPEGADYLAIHDASQKGTSIPLLILTDFNILDPGLTKMGQGQFEAFM